MHGLEKCSPILMSVFLFRVSSTSRVRKSPLLLNRSREVVIKNKATCCVFTIVPLHTYYYTSKATDRANVARIQKNAASIPPHNRGWHMKYSIQENRKDMTIIQRFVQSLRQSLEPNTLVNIPKRPASMSLSQTRAVNSQHTNRYE